MDFGAVDNHIMAYGYVVANLYGRLLVEGVQYGAVLNVHTVADADGIDIAAQHGAEPYAALVAHDHIAHYNGVAGQKTIFAYNGVEAPYTFYYSHLSVWNKKYCLKFYRVRGWVLRVSHSPSSSLSSGSSRARTIAW